LNPQLPPSLGGGDVTIEDLEHGIENVVAMMHMRDTRITENMESLRETVADHMVHLGEMQAREMRELREQVLTALAGKGGEVRPLPKIPMSQPKTLPKALHCLPLVHHRGGGVRWFRCCIRGSN
jgi:hypothetical protein